MTETLEFVFMGNAQKTAPHVRIHFLVINAKRIIFILIKSMSVWKVFLLLNVKAQGIISTKIQFAENARQIANHVFNNPMDKKYATIVFLMIMN
jgi:hypothetical protein